ncbi:hypothetical protein G9A89_007457 [Geosiphon pyriformis]|nr:hypothetical protein G9A89_007457 [Geosiphon pyriformis]
MKLSQPQNIHSKSTSYRYIPIQKTKINEYLSKTTGRTIIGKPQFQESGNELEENINDEQIKSGIDQTEIMLALAAVLKKRETQIAKSIDNQFEISKTTMIEILKSYLEKEDNITNKIVSEYKTRMDEFAEEKLNCLRKLRLGFEKYQLTTFNLLENLDKNYSQCLRARREFDKDMEQLQHVQEVEMAQLQEEIHNSSEHFHHLLANAAKESSQKPSISKQLQSFFKY